MIVEWQYPAGTTRVIVDCGANTYYRWGHFNFLQMKSHPSLFLIVVLFDAKVLIWQRTSVHWLGCLNKDFQFPEMADQLRRSHLMGPTVSSVLFQCFDFLGCTASEAFSGIRRTVLLSCLVQGGQFRKSIRYCVAIRPKSRTRRLRWLKPMHPCIAKKQSGRRGDCLTHLFQPHLACKKSQTLSFSD